MPELKPGIKPGHRPSLKPCHSECAIQVFLRQCRRRGRPLFSTVAPQRHTAHLASGVLCWNNCFAADCFHGMKPTVKRLKPAGLLMEIREWLRCFKATGMKWPLAQCCRDVTIDAPEERMLKHCTFQVFTMNTMKTRTHDPASVIDLNKVSGKRCCLKRYLSLSYIFTSNSIKSKRFCHKV